MGYKVLSNVFSSGVAVVSEINPNALRKIDIPNIKNFDSLAPSSTILNNTSDIIPTTAVAKVDINPAAVKQLESVPGATLYKTKATSILENYPKASLKGITALAAAGYITYLVGIEGLSLEDAIANLVETIVEATAEVVDTVVDTTGGAIGDIVSGILSGIFGENWFLYVQIVGGVFAFAFILKIMITIRSVLSFVRK